MSNGSLVWAEAPGLLGVESSTLASEYEFSEFKDPEATIGFALFIQHVSKITVADREAMAMQ